MGDFFLMVVRLLELPSGWLSVESQDTHPLTELLGCGSSTRVLTEHSASPLEGPPAYTAERSPLLQAAKLVLSKPVRKK